MKRPAIEDVRVVELKPSPNNARTHSIKQITQIAKSIKRFGFRVPILVSANHEIIAGHARAEAAKQAGLKVVPTIRIDDLSEAEVRAFMIADNKLAENAGWDYEILAQEFEWLGSMELEFDLTLTGFETGEIDVILDDANDTAESDPNDEFAGLDEGAAPVTRPGDLWICGNHRLICGNALDLETYERLMGNETAQAVFTDPPYNVPIDGHVCGSGKVKHREFAMAVGEMSKAEFGTFLSGSLGLMAKHSAPGAIHFVCMDWRHLPELLAAGADVYSAFLNLCVWAKNNGGMGSLYRSQHELVLVFKAGEGPHINNVELGKHGRYRTNVWNYAGINSFSASRDEDLAMHPTVKPVAMVADAIKDVTHRGGIVLDGFAGSGTTLVAAHETGRKGWGVELDPVYCDVILKRLSIVVGTEPVLEATGQKFSEVANERAQSLDASNEGGTSDAA